MVGIVFGFHTEGGMRNGAQAFLGYQFAGGAADAVGFVVDTHERGAQMVDELALTFGSID